MFGHIYKLRDGKWHLYGNRQGWADCGMDMDTLKEDRIFGQKGDKYYPDPPVSDVCPKCFSFLPEFQKKI